MKQLSCGSKSHFDSLKWLKEQPEDISWQLFTLKYNYLISGVFISVVGNDVLRTPFENNLDIHTRDTNTCT